MISSSSSARALQTDADCKPTGAPILRFDPQTPLITGVTWRKQEGTGPDLTLNHEVVVRGKHAACIELYQSGFILMRDGSVFRRRGDVLQRRGLDASPFFNRPPQEGPRLKGHRPVSVAGLSWSAEDKRRIALWSAANGSEVALFDAATGSKPVLLGTTGDKLRGITFFPSPDAPSGVVTLIHEIGPEHIRVISGTLRYAHRRR